MTPPALDGEDECGRKVSACVYESSTNPATGALGLWRRRALDEEEKSRRTLAEPADDDPALLHALLVHLVLDKLLELLHRRGHAVRVLLGGGRVRAHDVVPAGAARRGGSAR